jgi:hypothetical protein
MLAVQNPGLAHHPAFAATVPCAPELMVAAVLGGAAESGVAAACAVAWGVAAESDAVPVWPLSWRLVSLLALLWPSRLLLQLLSL